MEKRAAMKDISSKAHYTQKRVLGLKSLYQTETVSKSSPIHDEVLETDSQSYTLFLIILV